MKKSEFKRVQRAATNDVKRQRALAARKEALRSSTMGTGMSVVASDGKELFTQADIEHGLKLFDQAPIHDRKRGIQAVMMFALQAASINLGVA